ncbi:MAG TPA: dual specificity protein phosphatase family protein [Steroidobacteraceae bacterium]|nr:dual specificity protein phosphatase family protein [Steroidobacteraceae bacterium]
MDKIFWLLPGRLAGRSGPDRDPWDPDALLTAGIRAVLSVNDGEACDANAFAARAMPYACVPLSTNAPPLPGDALICREALPRAYAFVAAQLAQTRSVLVHCTAGKDRTGLFLAYFLLRERGLTPHAAIAAVREVRPIALSAAGWDALAREVLAHFALNPQRAGSD